MKCPTAHDLLDWTLYAGLCLSVAGVIVIIITAITHHVPPPPVREKQADAPTTVIPKGSVRRVFPK